VKSTLTLPVAPVVVDNRVAAAALGISLRKLWDLTAPRGPIACVKVGGSVRYTLRDLEAYVEKSRVTAENHE
jgi:hypothetical protein